MANSPSSRPARWPGRRSLLRPPALPLRLEALEARDVPSTSIPLTSEGWRDIGPSPITPEATEFPRTVAPGDLATAGRVVSVAVDPLNRNVIYAATSDGGLAKSVDGGATWATEVTIATDTPPIPDPDLPPQQKIRQFLMDNLPATTPVTANGAPRSPAEGGPTLNATDRNLRLGYVTTFRDRTFNREIVLAGGGNSNHTKFAHAGSGLWLSFNGGATWRLEKGPVTPFGNRAFEGASFQKILYVPNPDGVREHLFAVVSSGRTYGENFVNGVYRSDDLGTTWVDVTTNIVTAGGAPSEPITRFDEITDFSVDPSNPEVGYLSLGYPFRFILPQGGFRGETNNGVYRTQNALALNPAAQTNFTIVLGNSGGSTQIPGATLGYVRASPVPQRPSTVYALTSIAGGGFLALYRSTDSGINFNEVTGIPAGFFPSGAAMDMLIDPTTGPDRTRLYLSGTNGIVVVDVNELSSSPIARAANISVDDAGEGPHPTIYRVAFDRPLRAPTFPNDPLSVFGDTRLIVSTDAGVFRLETQVPPLQTTGTVSGQNWVSINGATARGLNSTLFMEGGQPVEDTNRFIGGTWRTGSPRFNDVGGLDTPAEETALYNWPATQGVSGPVPDGGEVIWNYRDRVPGTGQLNAVYQAQASTGTATVFKSLDAGVTWNRADTGIAFPNELYHFGDTSNPTPAFELDPSIPLTGSGNENIRLLYGTDVVNETVDSGATWRQFGRALPFVTGTPDQFQANIAALGVGRADRNVVYAYVRNRLNAANNSSRGPALYRLNQNLGDNTDNIPRWRDVTPWVNPNNAGLQTPDTFTSPFYGRVGFRMPDITGSPTEPYGNVLSGGPTSIFGLPFDITDIAVDPLDSNIIYLTLDHDDLTTAGTPDPNTRDLAGNYQPYAGPPGQVYGRVLRTTDGGLHWEDLSYMRGLPNYRVYSIVTDQNRLNGQQEDDLYIATEVGVWKLTNPTDPASQWTRVGAESVDDRDGMPDVMVRDLDLNGETGLMTASTFGRGAWQFPIRPFLSGFVYTDTNGNGTRDQGEDGIGGVAVTAIDVVPEPDVTLAIEVSLTDTANANRNDGFFQFTSLPNSSYDIRILDGSPAVYDPTKSFQVTTGTQNFNVTNAPRSTTINGIVVGVVPRATVSGVKFNDINGDGVRNAGEPGLAGWVIELRRGDNDALLDTTTTNASGAYAFSGVGVIPGAGFKLREVLQPGWTPTGQGDANGGDGERVVVTNGTGAALTVNFGNFRFINISGVKFHDLNGSGTYDNEPLLPGWTITVTRLEDGQTFSATTGANGVYQITGLGNGTYRVREVVQPGWGQTTAMPADFVARSGDPDPQISFGNFQNATVNGFLFEDENGNGVQDAGEAGGLPDVAVGLFDPANMAAPAQVVLTNAGGGYTFTNVQANGPNPAYVVRVVDAAIAQTEPDERVALTTSGGTFAAANLAGFRRTTVSGSAFEDVNGNGVRDGGEPPLAGSPITLVNAATGAALGTAVTNAAGQYTFFGVPMTHGQPVPPLQVTAAGGFIRTTPPGPGIVLTSGDPATAAEIGVFRAASVFGTKFEDANGNGAFDPGEPVLAGWAFQLVNPATGAVLQSAVTNAAGVFAFSVGPGTFAVREVPQGGWVQTTVGPAAFTTTSGATIGGQNFGNFRLLSIAGTVFHDFNGNGGRDAATDGPQPGWTVQLVNEASGAVLASAVTDGSGGYFFGALGPGRYRVQALGQPGWFSSTANPVSLAGFSGQSQVVNFGNFFGATVTGSVYEDLNRNATRDFSERPSSGWSVEIVNAAGVVVALTGTDANGVFTAGGLPPGTYTARLVPRGEFTRTTANPLQVTPTSGQQVTLAPPIGVLRLGSVSGQVFLDGNRNTVRDAFEKPLPSLAVSLFRDGVLIGSQLPGPDGRYAFLGLDAGNYTVRIGQPAGFTTTRPATGEYAVSLTVGSASASPDVVGLDFGVIGRRRYAVAADGGGGPRVQVYDAVSGIKLQDTFVYEQTFFGGVRVATGDVTGDGVDDLAVVAGKGGGPRVRVLDGLDGKEIYNFFAYEPSFRDGLYIGLGDVDGDGFADMITGTDAGGGPRVTVYSGRDGSQLADYFAYDPAFRGGVRIGAGDTNGDGRAEVITAPGAGGESQVIVWSGLPLAPVGSFFAFDAGYTGGVFVSGGGLRSDGRSDIVVGTGLPTPGWPGSRVRVYDPTTFQLVRDVDPYPTLEGETPVASEVRVTAIDRNGDNIADIGVSLGAGSPPLVKFLDGRNGRPLGDQFLAFEATFLGGVFIG